MFDACKREINYLRISVTDRCNLHCRYCMPEEGIEDIGHDRVLRYEEIIRFVKIAAAKGIRKVRLTGGEPLVRKDIVKLVSAIKGIPEIEDIALTTNGMLFLELAEKLRIAGLTRVNFSLDALDAHKFKYITRYGELTKVILAVHKALELGFNPVKINTVMLKGFNEGEILALAGLAFRFPLHVRFIECMPIGDLPFLHVGRLIYSAQVKEMIDTRYTLTPALPVEGSGPAKYFTIKDGKGTIGFISAISNHFCDTCNRVRLTADGKLRNCLFACEEMDVKRAMENGATDEELSDLFSKGVFMKPERHHLAEGWGEDNLRKMYQIGG